MRPAVIPWRRGIAKGQLRTKHQDGGLRSELGRGLGRLRQAMAPYWRFVLEERSRWQRVFAGLDEVSGRLADLESGVGEAAPAG